MPLKVQKQHSNLKFKMSLHILKFININKTLKSPQIIFLNYNDITKIVILQLLIEIFRNLNYK